MCPNQRKLWQELIDRRRMADFRRFASAMSKRRHLAVARLLPFFFFLVPLQTEANPYATGPPSSTSTSGNNGHHVDVIKDLEIGPTQVVVITNKEGAADRLRVKIEVTDLHDNRTLPVTDLSGLWLLITRGRYTIPFLKPDRWYGLSFRSENIIDNRMISHTENRLFRTMPRQGNGTEIKNMYQVLMHRNLEGEDSLENLYVTARWSGHERVNGSVLMVRVRVECSSSVTKDEIDLGSEDDSVTIEISMDHRYELEEVNRTAHEFQAHITPLQCKRLCWKPCLTADGGFSHEFPEECRDIKGTSGKTFLRNLKHYAVEENEHSDMELLVQTEAGEQHEQAFVTLSALRLDGNDSDVVYRSFSTAQSDGVFRLPLEDDGVYAVSYEYTKVKPFHYSAKEHFVVESPAVNLSRATHPPVEIEFEPKSFHEDHKKAPEAPTIIIARGGMYQAKEVRVNMDPFCGQDKTQIILNDAYPHHEMNATDVLCSQKEDLPFCEKSHNYTRCSPILCYNVVVRLEGTSFGSETRCLNVSQHFNLHSATCPVAFLPFFIILSLLSL